MAQAKIQFSQVQVLLCGSDSFHQLRHGKDTVATEQEIYKVFIFLTSCGYEDNDVYYHIHFISKIVKILRIFGS